MAKLKTPKIKPDYAVYVGEVDVEQGTTRWPTMAVTEQPVPRGSLRARWRRRQFAGGRFFVVYNGPTDAALRAPRMVEIADAFDDGSIYTGKAVADRDDGNGGEDQ